MPRLDAEALLFGLVWAALAVAAGYWVDWLAGAALAAALVLIVLPASALTLIRTDSLRTERAVRWTILLAAAAALAAWIAFRR